MATSGLLYSNINDPTKVAGYTPAQATTTQATATGYTAPTASTVNATSGGYTAAQNTVSPESTASGQLAKIIGSGSPLMQQAETQGLQLANKRGLLNSSMAVGSALDSTLRAATPLAINDANTYATSNLADTAARGRASEFGAAAGNAASLANAQLGTQTNITNAGNVLKAAGDTAAMATDVSKLNAQLGTNVSQTNAQAQDVAGQFMASGLNAQSLAKLSADTQTQLQQIQANTQLTGIDKQTQSAQLIAQASNAMQAELQRIQSSTQLSVAEKQIASQQLISAQDNLTKVQLQNIASNTSLTVAQKQIASAELIAKGDQATKTLLQQMQDATQLAGTKLSTDTQMAIANLQETSKRQLADAAAQNTALLNTNSNAAALLNNTLNGIANVSASAVDGAGKQVAVDNLLNVLRAGLQGIGEVSNLDLSRYFQQVDIAGTNSPAGYLTNTQPAGLLASTNTTQSGYYTSDGVFHQSTGNSITNPYPGNGVGFTNPDGTWNPNTAPATAPTTTTPAPKTPTPAPTSTPAPAPTPAPATPTTPTTLPMGYKDPVTGAVLGPSGWTMPTATTPATTATTAPPKTPAPTSTPVPVTTPTPTPTPSQTATATTPAPSVISNMISGLYTAYLGRQPDAAGLAYWTQRASAPGVNMGALREEFIRGAVASGNESKINKTAINSLGISGLNWS